MSFLESKKHKRQTLREAPFDPASRAIIEKRFPYFEKLSEPDQTELLGHVNVFLAEKKFEGCAGLELTGDMRLTIASQACLLLLHRETNYFPACDVILVYPHAYRTKNVTRAGHGAVIVSDEDKTLLGESHQDGVVVLSWDAVRGGATSDTDGHNVVLHEFAHQLDQEDGSADGAPVLEKRASYTLWAKVFGAEFEALKKEVDDGERHDIDAYGATNPAEFFAVVTEMFFEKPEKLAHNHLELYEQLAEFYKQDPLERLGVPRPQAKKPIATREVPVRTKTKAIIVCDMSSHLGVAELVGDVSDSMRESLRAMGCRRVGYMGTLNEWAPALTWVGEVMSGPDEHTVVVLYEIGPYGEGVAFWSLLENGTLIEVERSRVRPPTVSLHRVWPIHPRGDHVSTRWLGETPAKMYATHLEDVERVAAREKSHAMSGDALRLYGAVRLRQTDIFARSAIKRRALSRVVFWVVALSVAMLAVAALAALSDWATIGQRLPLVVALVCIAGGVVSLAISPRITALVRRAMFATKPVPAAELLARAEKIDDRAAARIASRVKENRARDVDEPASSERPQRTRSKPREHDE